MGSTAETSGISAERQTDADQRADDRQAHRDDRSERDQQDHDGSSEADALGRGNLTVDERLAAEGDLEVGD